MKNFKRFDDLFWRYMIAYKKRTIFTIFGIMLAVILFFGSGTIYVSIRHAEYEALKNQWGDYDAAGMINPKQYQVLKEKDYIEEIVLRQEEYLVFFNPREGFTESELTNSGESSSIYYMDDYQQEMFRYSLLEGRYPENNREVMVSLGFVDYYGYQIGDSVDIWHFEYWDGECYIGERSKVYDYLNRINCYDEEGYQIGERKEIEDLDTRLVSEEYLITGYYDDGEMDNQLFVNEYPVLSQIDRSASYQELMVYVRFKNHKNYIDLLAEEGIELYENETLLKHAGDFAHTDLEYILFMFAFIILFWIDVIIIRNAFVMSVAERTRDYGILRCMGTGQRKMRQLLMKEGLVEVVIGCVLGIGLSVAVIELGKYMPGIRQILYLLGIYDTFHVKFNAWITCGTIFFVACAVFFSLIEPSRQIGLMAPVEAINGNAIIKKEKFKKRNVNKIKIIFGIEGEYAFKNLLRNKGKFIVSTVGIAFSVVGIIISFSIINVMEVILDSENILEGYTGQANFRNGYDMTNEDVDNFVEELIALNSIEDAIPLFGNYYSGYWKMQETGNISKNSAYSWFVNGLEEAELKELESVLLEGTLDYEALEQGGVVICRNVQGSNLIGGEEIIVKHSIEGCQDIQVGDQLVIPNTWLDGVNNEGNRYQTEEEFLEDLEATGYITCPVVAIIDYYPSIHSTLSDVIFAKSFYQETICPEDTKAAGLLEIRLKFSENYDNAEIYEFCKNHRNYSILDDGSMESIAAMDGYRQLILLIAILIAGIGATNIFNTLSSNIALRHREFKIMSAVGMSRKQILKMLSLEGGLFAILGSVIGILLGLIVSVALTFFSMELKSNDIYYKIQYQIPWMGILISILMAVGITMISTLIAYKDLKLWEEDA